MASIKFDGIPQLCWCLPLRALHSNLSLVQSQAGYARDASRPQRSGSVIAAMLVIAFIKLAALMYSPVGHMDE